MNIDYKDVTIYLLISTFKNEPNRSIVCVCVSQDSLIVHAPQSNGARSYEIKQKPNLMKTA